jgi:hypothetical protein
MTAQCPTSVGLQRVLPRTQTMRGFGTPRSRQLDHQKLRLTLVDNVDGEVDVDNAPGGGRKFASRFAADRRLPHAQNFFPGAGLLNVKTKSKKSKAESFQWLAGAAQLRTHDLFSRRWTPGGGQKSGTFRSAPAGSACVFRRKFPKNIFFEAHQQSAARKFVAKFRVGGVGGSPVGT